MVLNGKWDVDFAKHQTNDEARLWEIAENLWGEVRWSRLSEQNPPRR
jgi:hypothetical protein